MEKTVKYYNTRPKSRPKAFNESISRIENFENDLKSSLNSESLDSISRVFSFTPKILLIGKGSALKEVTEKLKAVDAELEVINRINKLPDIFEPTLKAIVLVESKGIHCIIKECTKLVRDWDLEEIPIFAVVPDINGTWGERRLYDIGVQAVFEWPKEKNELPVLISNIIDLNADTSPDWLEERAHKFSLRTKHLAEQPHFNSGTLAVNVGESSGTEDKSSWSSTKLKSLKDGISSLSRLKKSFLTSPTKMAYSKNQKGNATKVDSPLYQQKLDDEAAARNIRRLIDDSSKLYPNDKIKVKVFYGRATLKGVVCEPSLAKEIEYFAKKTEGVVEVENKIRIKNWTGKSIG